MCGISGFIPLNEDVPKDKILEIVKFLLEENEIRGRDATGIVSWDIGTTNECSCPNDSSPISDKQINQPCPTCGKRRTLLITKQAEDAREFITHLTKDNILGPTIGHNRAQTRGSPEDYNNNHPMFGSKYCIIHNGMVHSMKELEGYPLKGKCDTEVLLSYIESFGVKGAIPKIDGSAALAIFSPTERKIYLYKHMSPLYVVYIPGKAIAFSSTETPLKKIGDMLGVEKVWGIFSPQTIAEVNEGQLLTFDVDTHEVSVETIKVENTYSYLKK